MAVLIGVLAVELVVGSHNSLGPALFDSDFKCREIYLAKRSLIDDGVHSHTALFLAVHCEMLDAAAHALALDTAHVGSGHLTRKMRIFRKVLKIAAAERAPLHVHARAEKNVDILRHSLFAESFSDLLAECLIPAVGHGCRCRETCCFQGFIEAEVIAGSRLLADSVRTVGTVHGLDAKARNRPGLPFALSAEYSGFLFKGHPFNQILVFHENLLPLYCSYSRIRSTFVFPTGRSAVSII